MSRFPFTDQLFETNPFEFSVKNKNLFLKSFQENALTHYQNNEMIRGFWDLEGIHPTQITSEEDLKKAPFTMVHLFKENALKSVPDAELVLTLTSSGTGGTKSRQFLNEESLRNVKKLAFKIHEALGMTSSQKYNYLCFTYDPKIANDLGTAFTDELLTNFTGKLEVYYTIQWNELKKDFEFNKEGTIQALKRFEESKLPLRILGFPAFLHQLVEEYNLHMTLGPQSWLQTGGGWKGAQDQEIPKQIFRAHIEERLGIPQSHIRDLFGMVEHGIPYVDCELGELHIPNYARVFIRDPKTLAFLKDDEVGLIQFLCTYNSSYPAFNLLTTDYGSISTCSCPIGKKAGNKILKIKGRAGITKHKGCAIKALDMVRK